MHQNLFLLTLAIAATTGGTGAALAQPATAPAVPTRNAVLVDQAGEANATERPRVVVSTDIGGTDPDDFQPMVHLLVYADDMDIEGLVSSPYGPGRARHIHEVIDVYERDSAALRARSAAYPTPAALRAVTKQGALVSPGAAGFGASTEGSEWIVRCARKPDPRPLWVLVWGGIKDLAQALHDAPDILPKLRVYFIGGPNKMWSIDAYDYIDREHPRLWMIEANATYRGWFTGGNQTGEWGNAAFVAAHVAGRGALGDYFATHLRGTMKMGDTPSVMHVLRAAPEDPTQGGWGGRFVRVWEGRKTEFARLTTAADTVEVFGTVEWALPLPAGTPPGAKATMLIDGRIPAVAHHDGRALRFRFSPRDGKIWPYVITSGVRELDGVKGAITAAPPPLERTRVASVRRPNWWIDDPAPEAAEGVHPGAKHVNRWREKFLRDFAARMTAVRATRQSLPVGSAAGTAGSRSLDGSLGDGAVAASEQAAFTVRPKEYPRALRNPLMGFRPDLGRHAFGHEYATLARHYIKWNEIENDELDGIDRIRAFCNEKWKGVEAANIKVIPRVYLHWSKDDQKYWPADMKADDYASDQFKGRVLRLVARLGECWDNDPRVAFIQMGLIGKWGEHHSPVFKPTPSFW
jgi:hypothetical protein